MAAPRQRIAELAVAIDFAVEDDPALAVGREHRLIRAGPQVDDRQPTETDVHGATHAEVAGVGPAMGDRGESGGVVPARISSANEAAHGCSPRCREWAECSAL